MHLPRNLSCTDTTVLQVSTNEIPEKSVGLDAMTMKIFYNNVKGCRDSGAKNHRNKV